MVSRKTAWSLPIGITLLCVCLYLFVDSGDGGKLRFLTESARETLSPTSSACTNDRWETCADVKYRDVSDVFACRGHGTPDLSGLDFRQLIRLRSGVTPRLLSTRTRPVTVGAAAGSDGLKYVVPNVVHYIHFGKQMKFGFMQYISYLSAHKFIKPDYIFLHGDYTPVLNSWWNRTLAEVPNIYHVFVKSVEGVNGKKFHFPTQHSNLLRLHILLDYGGIYLDHDVIVVKSFDPLRKYDFTIGREVPFSLNNGIMLGRQGTPFAQIWLEIYRSPRLDMRNFGYESVRMAHNLSVFFPHLVHIEDRSLAHPNYLHAELFYRDYYDWSGNYAIHVMREHTVRIPKDPTSLDGYDCLLGEVMRFVYYGDSKLRSKNKWKGMK